MDENYANAQKILDDIKKETKEMEIKGVHEVERIEDLSIQNFASWRDYLHKYFGAIFLLIGATGFLQNKNFEYFYFKLGLWLALAGVFLGYIVINIYFYIERRWFQASYLISVDGASNQFTHPEMKTEDTVEALLLHNRDFINKLEERLNKANQEKNKMQSKYINRMIKRNKKIACSFKFIGQHFELVEKIWITGVSLSVFLTMIGSVLLFANIKN